MIRYGIIITFLVITARYDIKERGIPIKWLLFWAVIEIGYLICFALWKSDFMLWVNGLFGLIPGIVCVFISYVSREQIGYGDGYVIMLIGFLEGYKKAIGSFLIALFLLVIVAAVLLVIRKATKKTRLPLVPFLVFGYLSTIILFR